MFLERDSLRPRRSMAHRQGRQEDILADTDKADNMADRKKGQPLIRPDRLKQMGKMEKNECHAGFGGMMDKQIEDAYICKRNACILPPLFSDESYFSVWNKVSLAPVPYEYGQSA